MRRLLLPIAALVLSLPASAQTLDQIVSRHLKAQGNPEALKALKTLRLTMKTVAAPGMEFPMTITTVMPNKSRLDMQIMGQDSVVVINGKQSWWIQPMLGKTEAEPIPEAMLEDAENQSKQYQSPLLDYQAKGHKVELVGKAQVDGAETFHLKLTPKKEGPMDLYLDAETYLLTQMHLTKEVQGQKMELTSRMGDYKPVAGILMAHTIDTKIAGMPMSPKVTIEKAEANVPVEESLFVMPSKKPAPVAPPAKK